MILRKAAPFAILFALGACARNSGEIDASGGITAVRTACPTVGVPAGTGDITLFDPVTSRAASAVDVSATLTNVRSTCDDTGDNVITNVTFEVRGRRARAEGARELVLPYFVTVVRGGNQVISKRVSRVSLRFEPGQPLATATGQATASVSRAAATLPKEVRERLTRRRKAGDEDAALDPLARPDVREAVLRASFEALVGFQLTADQLKYNAQR